MSTPSPQLPLEARAVPALPALPPLRLLPAPPCAPPYDDERPAGTAGWRAPVRTLGPLRDLVPRPLRLVGPLPAVAFGEADELPRQRTPSSALPPARAVAHALVQGLLEVLAGVRPVQQLQRATSPELFAELEQAVQDRPPATGRRPATGAVRSLHVQERPDGVAEVCATVRREQRMAAVVLRLEGTGSGWCCTELSCV